MDGNMSDLVNSVVNTVVDGAKSANIHICGTFEGVSYPSPLTVVLDILKIAGLTAVVFMMIRQGKIKGGFGEDTKKDE